MSALGIYISVVGDQTWINYRLKRRRLTKMRKAPVVGAPVWALLLLLLPLLLLLLLLPPPPPPESLLIRTGFSLFAKPNQPKPSQADLARKLWLNIRQACFKPNSEVKRSDLAFFSLN